VLGRHVSDLAGAWFAPRQRVLLLLSQESRLLVEVTLDGQAPGLPSLARRVLLRGIGSCARHPTSVPCPRACPQVRAVQRISGTQPEGVALSPDLSTLFLASEPNELLVYRRPPSPLSPPPPSLIVEEGVIAAVGVLGLLALLCIACLACKLRHHPRPVRQLQAKELLEMHEVASAGALTPSPDRSPKSDRSVT